MTADLLVVGELNPDIVVLGVDSERLRFGQAEDFVTRTSLTLGSSAAITAAAAVRSGAEVRLLAVVGDDDLGRLTIQWANACGIDTTPVRVATATHTGSTVILVDAKNSSERHALTDLGTMAALRAEDLSDMLLKSVRHIHVSSFFMHTGAREDLHERLVRARDLGCTVSLDTNADPDDMWGYGAMKAVAASDICFVNTTELLGLTQSDDEELAVRRLLIEMPHTPDPRYPAIVHKRGAEGATVHTLTGRVSVAAPTVEVVDTVGAGDTLAGTALHLLLSGANWSTALRHGVAAASLSTTATGGVAAARSATDATELAATLVTTLAADNTMLEKGTR